MRLLLEPSWVRHAASCSDCADGGGGHSLLGPITLPGIIDFGEPRATPWAVPFVMDHYWNCNKAGSDSA